MLTVMLDHFVTRIIQEYRETIEEIERPAKLSDFNPTENIWGVMNQQLSRSVSTHHTNVLLLEESVRFEYLD